MGELGTDKEEALEWLLDKLSAAKKEQPRKSSVQKFTPVKTTPFKPATPFKPFAAPSTATKEQKKAALTATKASEVELWKKWKKSGEKPEHLTPLIESLTPLINKRLGVFSRAEVPKSAVEQEHREKVVDALRTWNPKQGGLNTWIDWKMKNAKRYVEKYKNPGRIPENISKYIGSYNAVKSDLREQLGHEPDVHKIHEYVMKTKHDTLKNASLKDLIRVEREQRKSFIDTGFESEKTGPAPLMSSREEEVKYLIVPELTDQERTVHEYSVGMNGRPMLKPGQIAKVMKIDGPKVAKLRTSIWNKMKPYLGEK